MDDDDDELNVNCVLLCPLLECPLGDNVSLAFDDDAILLPSLPGIERETFRRVCARFANRNARC